MHIFSRLILRITHHLSPPHSPPFSKLHQIHTQTTKPQNHKTYNYLTNNLNFPKTKALNYSKLHSLQNPETVVSYFKSLGFTDAQIINLANLKPKILFSHIEQTLKPKIEFFQELGLSGSDLGEFVSKSSILGYSLNKLKLTVGVIRDILTKYNVEDVNEKLLRILGSNKILAADHKRILANSSYLKDCGVLGSQLARVLVYNPTIMVCSESYLKKQVSRALDLGFCFHSGMFMHGLSSISNVSDKSFLKKLKLFESFGFTEVEFMGMVKSSPNILGLSEEKLRVAIGFYLGTVGLEKSELIHYPVCLMYSMENRVVPRYKVVNLMKSKGVLKKERSFTCIVMLSEDKFKEYITRFPDHAKDLWMAYKGHLVDSSE